MKRFSILFVFLFVAISAAAELAPKHGGYNFDCERRLIAGQNLDVGYVGLDWRDDELYVRYELSPDAIAAGWKIKEVHFGWWAEESDLPIHAVPGQLQYARENLDTTSYDFVVAHNTICTFTKCDHSCPCWFAAHAVVRRDCPTEKNIYVAGDWPAAAKIRVSRMGRSSYFNVEIDGPRMLRGHTFNGWCLDSRLELPDGQWLDSGITYDWSELDGIVEKPENMQLIAWIVRQNYVGRQIRCGEIVQRHHVQNAIWHLAQGRGMGCVAQAIVDDARRATRGKNLEGSCWKLAADFVLTPRLCTMIAPPDGFACQTLQPIYSYRYQEEECPTKTPTATQTNTYTPTSTRTPRPPTSTPTRTFTVTQTPTGTPSWTPSATPSFTPTDTPTATATSTSTPCPPQEETAWAFGSVEFGIGWGWFFECCEGE